MNWQNIFQGLVTAGIISSVAVQIKLLLGFTKLQTWATDHDKQDDERHVQMLAAVIAQPKRSRKKK
jgi:hypothetical protein